MLALRPGWAEAVATLGGRGGSYWLRVGVPILTPAFLGSLLLLPLHLLRRLWSLHIVFMLRPELRDASPEARMFRVLR